MIMKWTDLWHENQPTLQQILSVFFKDENIAIVNCVGSKETKIFVGRAEDFLAMENVEDYLNDEVDIVFPFYNGKGMNINIYHYDD